MNGNAWRGAILAVALTPVGAAAELHLSGLADFVGRNTSEEDITNKNFRPSSNLDVARLRLFFDADVNDNTEFFTQFLISRYADVFLYSAYIRFSEIGGAPVNMHLGLIPPTVGPYAARTYSDRNPLVGVPLVHNHHSVLNPFTPQTSVEDLLAARDDRTSSGLPLLYDNCWNTGAEVFGRVGSFDWSLAALSGSTTLPVRSQEDKIPQGTARLGWYAGPGFILGVSGYLGPYLWEGLPGISFGDGQRPADFLNGGAGYDLYWGFRYLEVYSETYHAFWQHPTLPTLQATSGYVEARHKFLTRFYVASRFGFFEPNEVADSSGQLTKWDYPVRRLEYGLGFKPGRRVTTKVVAQHNRFEGNDSLARNHYMIQVSAGF